MEIQSSLSDVKKYLEKGDSRAWEKLIDKAGGLLLTAGTIIYMFYEPSEVIATLATGASLSAIKPSNYYAFIRDKIINRKEHKEEEAKSRYETLSMVNLITVHLSAKEACRDILFPNRQRFLIDCSFDQTKEIQLEEYIGKHDNDILNNKLSPPMPGSKVETEKYLRKIFSPIQVIIDEYLEELKQDIDSKDIIDSLVSRALLIYNAFLIHLAKEHREFALWVDIEYKDQIVEYCKEIADNVNELNEKIEKIEMLIKGAKDYESDFYEFEELINRQTDIIKDIIDSDAKREIRAYHNMIKSYLDEPVAENRDIQGIVYPSNNEMYIPQSFRVLNYNSSQHSKKILNLNFWESNDSGIVQEENIWQRLSISLSDIHNTLKPVLILGHPGAGKSMLSSILSARLCDSDIYFPFLIKLRTVNSSSSDIDTHINQGIKGTLPEITNVNWVNWAYKFPGKIPVIIFDGFDELVQTGNTHLNDYLLKIQDRQEEIFKSHGIAVRVIITSRLTMMEQVTIPENATIIKLDSFNKGRQEEWIRRWNSFQGKEGFIPFKLPRNKYIEELAKEPLLLFLLAIYDYEGGELQYAAKVAGFNQSKLYDSLFERFTIRQLSKIDKYEHITLKNYKSNEEAKKEAEKFRLGIGLIALMMFLNDKIVHNCDALKNELEQFDLVSDDLTTEKVFTGFFFVHENRSENSTGQVSLNFEFLHKTFGEFLAADFLLRAAKYRKSGDDEEKISQEDSFKFCFGSNWLYKHPKIISFMFEHSRSLLSEDDRKGIEKIIKRELRTIFEKSKLPFPALGIRVQQPAGQPILKQLAIYSQNLIFLWLAISDEKGEIEFNLPIDKGAGLNNRTISTNDKINYDISQDLDEVNTQKNAWKQLCALWFMFGNSQAVAKLGEWVRVRETEETIQIKKYQDEVNSYFGKAAEVSCNDYELLMSFYNTDFSIEGIQAVLSRKPELTKLAFDVVYNRFEYLLDYDKGNLDLFIKTIIDSDKETVELLYKSKLLIKMLKYERLHSIDAEALAYSLFEVVDRNNITADDKILIALHSQRFISEKSLMYDIFQKLFGDCRDYELYYLVQSIDFLDLAMRWCRNRVMQMNMVEFAIKYVRNNKTPSIEYKPKVLEFLHRCRLLEEDHTTVNVLLTEMIGACDPGNKFGIRFLEALCRYMPDSPKTQQMLKRGAQALKTRKGIQVWERQRLLDLIFTYSNYPLINEELIVSIKNMKNGNKDLTDGEKQKLHRVLKLYSPRKL